VSILIKMKKSQFGGESRPGRSYSSRRGGGGFTSRGWESVGKGELICKGNYKKERGSVLGVQGSKLAKESGSGKGERIRTIMT